MSKLNINRNIFLEKEELVKFQDFLINDTVHQVMLDNTSKWGIVKTVFEGTAPDFLVQVGTNVGTVKITTLSKAVDSDKLLIKQVPIDNISVPNDGLYYWVKISHQYSNLEEGTCSINTNGEVTGLNTLFQSVLRGQSTEVPVKIKFYKSGGVSNSNTYEVVSITDNLNILLAGTGFVNESSLNYIVIGSTPVGETIVNSQLEGLYQYDSCKIELIEETTLDTAPVLNYITDKQFYIVRVKNTSGTVTVQDKRGTQYLTFNVEGVDDKLDKSQNLADILDKTAARANLGVLTAEDVAALFIDSGWKPMANGVAASSTNFDLKIRRIGKLCIIQGTFKGGSNTSVNAAIATVSVSDIFLPSEVVVGVSQKIYFGCGVDVTPANVNRGILGYLNTMEGEGQSNYLTIRVDKSESPLDLKFNVNFSFFLG